MQSKQSAFSLIEVILVIVVLGIVASISSQIISRLYMSYWLGRVSYEVNADLDILLNQLDNRLHYAINNTISIRQNNHSSPALLNIGAQIDLSDKNILQWVSADFDGINAISTDNKNPGWSGRIDVNRSNKTNLYLQASNLNLSERIISNLSHGDRGVQGSAVYFKDKETGYTITGFNSTQSLLQLSQQAPLKHDSCQLAWSSYAIELTDGTLYLYYDMMPSIGTSLSSYRSILAKHISKLRITKSTNTISVEICMKRQIYNSEYIESCKQRHIQ